MTATTALTELTGDYALDAALTRIGFVARHTMATKVPGHFEAFEGHAHLDGDAPSKSTAAITIQAASIRTHNPRRDQALRDKFLDAPNHPAITFTFTSTEIEQIDGRTFTLTGNLTIRGATNPVTIPFTLTGTEPDRVRFEGTVPINRRDWGAHWKAAGFLVSKQVILTLDVTVARRP
jgi:polyisoprenoid-binding protein YceI